MTQSKEKGEKNTITSLRKVFVLAVALVLALTVGGGAASAQDGEMVAFQLENPHYDRSQPLGGRTTPFTRLGIAKVVGSVEGVTVDLAANTVRLAPGQYYVSGVGTESSKVGNVLRLYMREYPSVYGEDSTGTTVEMAPVPSRDDTFVVVNGDGATPDDVKLGTAGRRVDFSCFNGSIRPRDVVDNWIFIRLLGD